jgi:3-oxoacyl-[acyl-carrier protein] reductase
MGRRKEILEKTCHGINQAISNSSVVPIQGDLSLPEDVRRVAEKLAKLGWVNVDVLVNNAGGVFVGPEHTLEEVAEDWTQNFRKNVLTACLITTQLLPMIRSPGGTIINVSSIAALRGGGGSYSAAKAAVIGWTYDLAVRLGNKGVRVNAVVPGYVTETEFFGDRMTPARHEKLVSQTLLGRPGRPEEIASVVKFLASDEASYITGQLIQVNGGSLLGR